MPMQSILYTILLAVLDVLVIVGGAGLVYFLATLIKKNKLDMNDSTMYDITSVVSKIVATVNQTIVSKYKAMNPDNKLTDDQAAEIFNNTRELILNCLTRDEMKQLINRYGDGESAIRFLVESELYDDWRPNKINDGSTTVESESDDTAEG